MSPLMAAELLKAGDLDHATSLPVIFAIDKSKLLFEWMSRHVKSVSTA
jgi:hypothetical protein